MRFILRLLARHGAFNLFIATRYGASVGAEEWARRWAERRIVHIKTPVETSAQCAYQVVLCDISTLPCYSARFPAKGGYAAASIA